MGDNPASRRLLPPAYFLLAIAIMLTLHYRFPMVRWLGESVRLWGLAPIILGVVVGGFANAQFRRRGTTVKPFQLSSALVTGGLFRVSRNPMYLAMVLILTGIAVVLGSLTPLVVVPLFVWLMTALFIRHEEASLEEQFGDDYTGYKQSVRRWF
jgi:protein-S-isoprenylcysteine O-methyltransferase Ste14